MAENTEKVIDDELSLLMDNALSDFGKLEEKSNVKPSSIPLKDPTKASEAKVVDSLDKDATDDISKLLSSLSNVPHDAEIEDDLDAAGEVLPMLKLLLAKDIMQPSFVQLQSSYQTWLTSNRTDLDEETRIRYERQAALVDAICREYDDETDSDTMTVKDSRAERIVKLMQDMQDLGTPPDEVLPAGGGNLLGGLEGLLSPTGDGASLDAAADSLLKDAGLEALLKDDQAAPDECKQS